MFIICSETIANPGVLETRSLPKKFLGRVMLWPRLGAGFGLWARLFFEMQLLRYMAALIPFVIPMFVWRDLAAPIAQAPLAMVIVIALVELRVLRLSEQKRERLLSEDEAAQRLDLLTYRARNALREVAARRDLSEGGLSLVVEQSELARVAPLTLVTVQTDFPQPAVVNLDAGDRAALVGLFDAALTERDLHAANQRQQTFLRSISIETRAVSAHARLAAWIDKDRAAQVPQGV